MRLVGFNIKEGLREPLGRYNDAVEMLRRLEGDLILLQECMDWSPDELQALGDLLGLRHTFFTQSNPRGSGRRYSLGALSRRPFQRTISHTPSVLAHGLQEIRLGEISFFNLHLVARTEEERLPEIEFFLEQAHGGVLVGDLNSLSSRDPYSPDSAQRLLEAGVTKYGAPFRFDVLELLEQHGWEDVLAGAEPWATRWRDELEPPVPTRTDYILSKGVPVRKGWVQPLLKSESDHYPVLAEI